MDGNGPATSEPDTGKQNLTLHILSPSTEVPDRITFTDCSPSTTIADLKAKIRDVVVSRPALERQRLIYRGRLLQDNGTLAEIFTHNAISIPQEFSLHLVLPPAIPPQVSSTPTAPTSTAQRPLHPMAPETGRVAATLQQQGVHNHRAMPQPPIVQPQAGLNVPFPMAPGQFPPHLQNALQNHLQALGQQIGTQMAMHGNQVGQGLPSNAHQAHGPEQHHHQQPLSPPSFQQIVAQQQQARAAAGRQGVGDNTAGQEANTQAGTPGPTPAATPSSNDPRNPSLPSPHIHAATHNHHQNPSGEGWRMVIQSTSTVTGLNSNLQRVPTPVNIAFQQPPAAVSHPAPAMPVGNIALQGPGNGPPSAPNQTQLQILEQEISAIQTTLTRGTAPAPSVFDNVRTMLRNVENISATPGLEAMLRTQIENLSMQADQLRTSLNRMLMQVVSQQSSSQPTLQPTNVEQLLPHRNPTLASPSPSSVYVLSSPNGPQALLVSPAGTYRAPWHLPTLPLTTHHPRHNRAFNQQPNNNNNNNNAAPAPQPRIIPANGAHAQAQQQHQHRHGAAHANEARDIIRLLLPLGGHIWLLIRLFGFVYFFTAGGGSRRALLLGFIAFVVFVAQTGLFRPLIPAIWDPLRRHVEGLVAGNPDPPANPPPAAAEAAQPDREPTPQEAAARLLQQRQRRDTGAFREQIRRIERAVALFVASLVPGFGERQIEAREAARRAEERARREAAEAERRDAEAEAREHTGPGAAQGEGEGPAEQAPLVEI